MNWSIQRTLSTIISKQYLSAENLLLLSQNLLLKGVPHLSLRRTWYGLLPFDHGIPSSARRVRASDRTPWNMCIAPRALIMIWVSLENTGRTVWKAFGWWFHSVFPIIVRVCNLYDQQNLQLGWNHHLLFGEFQENPTWTVPPKKHADCLWLTASGSIEFTPSLREFTRWDDQKPWVAIRKKQAFGTIHGCYGCSLQVLFLGSMASIECLFQDM